MKKYTISNNSVLLNMDKLYCDNESQVLKSQIFHDFVKKYLRYLKKQDKLIYQIFHNISPEIIVDFYKHLYVNSYNDLITIFPNLKFLTNRDIMFKFTENFYEFWRKYERYAIFNHHRGHSDTTTSNLLIKSSQDFEALILKLYRSFSQKIQNKSFSVYRQLSSGVTATLLLRQSPQNTKAPRTFIQSLLINTPIMLYSKANIRTGLFKETFDNPLEKINFNKNYYVFPVWCGNLLAHVYIHQSLLGHGIALGNLFEFANYRDIYDKEANLICVFGTEHHELDGTYYFDKIKNTYIGIVSNHPKNDYFGYLKKMILTLHNSYMIEHGYLPIHGAMVQITFKNKKIKNVVILGDSGAGKSETIEALRQISTNIDQIKIIYDDMGVFKLDDNLYSQGTETGAFVRLDDLEAGYAYQNMDRSIFLNPNKTNARVVLPVTTHEFICKKHQIDLLLYANNYDDPNFNIRLFDNISEAINVFSEGKRMAKGTTSETGLSSNFFANPFGPIQNRKKTELLIKKYFTYMFDHNIRMGEIYTRLSINKMRETGPKMAAESLLKLLSEDK